MKYRMKHAPMGWNSYDYYDTTVTEREVRGKRGLYGGALKTVRLGIYCGGHPVVCKEHRKSEGEVPVYSVWGGLDG